jgi:hypothetical protein
LQLTRQPQPCGPALQTTITADFVLGKTGNRSAVALEQSIFANAVTANSDGLFKVSRRRRATVRRESIAFGLQLRKIALRFALV